MLNIPVPQSLFEKLNDLPDTFYLTGSQFFNNCSNDFDFFVAMNDGIIQRLKDIGFSSVSNSKYGDTNCFAVYRAFESNGMQIDIQIVRDVNLKHKVQTRFKELGYTHPTQEQWNLAFTLFA